MYVIIKLRRFCPLPGNGPPGQHEVKQRQQTYMDYTSASNLTTSNCDHEGLEWGTSNADLKQISDGDAGETLEGLPRQLQTVIKESQVEW